MNKQSNSTTLNILRTRMCVVLIYLCLSFPLIFYSLSEELWNYMYVCEEFSA